MRKPSFGGRHAAKTVLRLPDLAHAKSSVLNSLASPESRRSYELAIRDFVQWYEMAPHDLRRTCAHLCHVVGGDLEQIQFLLGHVSEQTTERFLGCKQKIKDAVNDRIGIEP